MKDEKEKKSERIFFFRLIRGKIAFSRFKLEKKNVSDK